MGEVDIGVVCLRGFVLVFLVVFFFFFVLIF
jgi:hypothetical protein